MERVIEGKKGKKKERREREKERVIDGKKGKKRREKEGKERREECFSFNSCSSFSLSFFFF